MENVYGKTKIHKASPHSHVDQHEQQKAQSATLEDRQL